MQKLYGEFIGELLIRLGKLSREKLEEALKLQAQSSGDKRLGELLVELGYCTEDDVVEALSIQTGLPIVNLREERVDPDAIMLLPPEVAYRHMVLPIERRDSVLKVAIADPLDIAAEDALRFITGLNVEPYLARPSEIKSLIEQHYMRRVMQESQDEQIEVIEEVEEEIGDPTRLAKEALVIRLVDMLVRNAVRERATDIHIEPFERTLRIRYRIDGVLHEVPAPAKRFHAAIVSRIKIMSNLDITERRRPQDGRIRIRVLAREIDLRVSIIPTMFGESVVLRILDRSSSLLTLEQLGMMGDDLSRFERIIQAPYGILLATGPTGSGKTTTLYAAIQRLYTPELKFITIEDPVEYQIDGVNQIQINPQIGLTFANALRSILRHDPDIIMVGEIRDRETAEIAIHAALTGHLVFSTLHTNDAPGAITRLLEMGMEPFLVSSALQGILAQRLVRKICEHCKVEYEPGEVVRRMLISEGFEEAVDCKFYRGAGCDECRYTGYFGRTGIFELLAMDEAIRELVLRKAPAGEIRQVAIEHGMHTLLQDGLRKVLLGITTIEEVERVTQLPNGNPPR
ncbi:MAG: type II secretion system ATPase GspE [Armatimonadetes bacterium]|nr:type II secretion system ATPase GspE [Armatimonadota bacterium]MCX7776890.1 type II secretion system ATPase GspE [Armatimonadota bacterium]